MRSPCSLGRVPTSVPPAIIEDLHTIADLRDPDQIRRDSDAGATRWPTGGGSRHHVLRLVREYVPAIMEELHTIVDLSDPDEIRRDIDACATR